MKKNEQKTFILINNISDASSSRLVDVAQY